LLVRLAAEMDLGDLHFQIFGKGWNRVGEQLRAGGASVDLYEGSADYAADYAEICKRVPEFDYYLYLGLDEGALGTLDALAAGVPTITAPQGFHLDVTDGITHPFWDYQELKEIIESLVSARRRRIDGVANLSWTEYARNHVQVWDALLAGREIIQIPGQDTLEDVNLTTRYGNYTIKERAANYVKLSNPYRWKMLKTYYSPRLKRRVKDIFKRVTPNGNR